MLLGEGRQEAPYLVQPDNQIGIPVEPP